MIKEEETANTINTCINEVIAEREQWELNFSLTEEEIDLLFSFGSQCYWEDEHQLKDNLHAAISAFF